MKKAIAIILLIVFGAGLYFNFVHTGSVSNDTTTEDQESAKTENNEDNQNNESAEDSEASTDETETSEQPDSIAFNESSIQEQYDQRIANNEALIVDVLTPAYYNSDFADRLNQQFDTNTIQFNQVEMPGNTVDMNELTVNDNSDIVIMDAMQIADYNDEVLPERNLNNLRNAYMDLYNADKTVIILGNANVHEHENLADTLSNDAEYFPNNDFFYIDNQEVSVENPYNPDDNVMNPAVEDEIINNIQAYLLQ
ncbi:hypothetical protein [Jeotgalicoccus sp. ATCC 8456]|uniref:hypothetical protein n=1 Tax=Jeotgalicoccus sp. ATCC 8456 TaxID=946435 RepID=UPI0018E5B6F1|nr:hypothetical protein [Jeotgalicoccus sp. ATCC 8456]QQD85039.1 hypothetical protein JEM45_10655 [Jeotgalicoccus sp. ATCC 8456]